MGDQSASEVAELKRKLGNAVRKGKAIEAQYKEAKARLEGADAIASRVAELEAALEQKDVAEERQLAEAEAAHADTLEKLQDITARHLEALERAGRLEKELEEGRAAWQAKPAASTPHGAESPHANGTTAVAHQLQQLNEGLRKQLEDAQSHLSVAEHQLAERSDSTSSVSGVDAQALAELTDEVEVLKEALDVAADKIRDLQTSEQEAVARSNTLAKECAELRKTASAATARVEEAVATEQAATQAAEQAARLEKVARDRVLALEVELAAAQESAAQAQQVAEQVADLEAQVAHAEERAAAAETAAAEAVADATARTENAAAREAAADERLQQAEAEVAKAQAEAARLAEENESRRQKFSVLHVTFAKKEAEFKEALEVAEAEVASSRAAAADAEEAELAARKAKIEAERRAEEALASVDASIVAATASVQQQLAEAHAASKAAEARAEEAEIAWEEAKRQVEALKAAAEAAEDHAEALQQLEASLEAASKEKNDLATQLQAAQRDVTLLRDSCRQLESDIAALKAQQAPGKGGLNSPEGASNGEAVTSLDMEALQQAASRSQATHAAQIAELQKQNKELAWQVAMLTRVNPGGAQQTYGRAPPPGAVVVPMPPAFGEEGPRATSFARLTALVLRYRKYLVVVYLVALHALVYFSAVQGTSRCSDTIQ